MTEKKSFIAFDLGANSGRAVLGKLHGNTLRTKEIHRFDNYPVEVLGTIHWDVLRLLREIKEALKKYSSSHEESPDSLGLDTWGVDFGLLDGKGRLIENPVHYRDNRTDGIMSQALEISSRKEIFQTTGIQFMEINTLYQLMAVKNDHPRQLERSKTFLMIAGLFHYFLTGQIKEEFSLATTTQLYDPIEKTWVKSLFDKFGLPKGIMPEVENTGTRIGTLGEDIKRDTGMGDVPVTATATHDTASAVSAIPAKSDSWAFISSGTWSLLGKEVERPVINREVMDANFTNEGCRTGKFTLHKNLTGLWIVQECKREWEKAEGKTFSYEEITRAARKSRPFQALIDTQAEVFSRPGGMPEKIRNFCRKTNQFVPNNRAGITRSVLEGLALNYRLNIEKLENLTDETIETIHIVGGGAKNELLSQFCANVTGKSVITGPAEATATGNILNQAIAQGYLASIEEARDHVRNSFELKTFEANNGPEWDLAYEKFTEINKD